MRVRNTDVQSRIYNDLQRPDGRTLELASGEEAEIVVPESLADGIAADPFLQIVEVAETRSRRARSEPSQEQETA